jgi:hypothetical protein
MASSFFGYPPDERIASQFCRSSLPCKEGKPFPGPGGQRLNPGSDFMKKIIMIK